MLCHLIKITHINDKKSMVKYLNPNFYQHFIIIYTMNFLTFLKYTFKI